METTEPTVELKLKKGGHVNMKKGGKAEAGHKKMAGGGGAMEMMMGTPALVGRPAVNAPVRAPGKPSMASRRKSMMAKKPAMPSAPAMGMPPMKNGGESKKTHTAEMSKMKGLEKELKSHESKPASKGHKGLKTGGVSNGQGGYKTGGVALGNGGGYKTGGVSMSNAGGYKMGGKTSKKAYAAGGTVNSGHPVAMPQGAKKPSSPVSTNRVAGTFKKGGTVTPAEGNLMKAFGRENASAMKSAKAQSNDVYSKYQKMQKGGAASGEGAVTDRERKMMDEAFFDKNKVDPKAVSDKASRELEEAMNPLSMVKELYGKARDAFRGQGSMTNKEKDAFEQKMPFKSFDMKGIKPENFEQKMPFKSVDMKGMKPEDFEQKMPYGFPSKGAITQTERSVTVSPAGKRRGGRAC
jgi:hypothetical protein